ncbi:MAG: hypothetical protein ACK559_31065, partial [bacterium]
IIPGKLFLNYFFAFTSDFCFQALILKICNSSTYIITDFVGKIQNIEQNILNYIYNMKNSKLSENVQKSLILQDIHLSLIVPQFFDITD